MFKLFSLGADNLPLLITDIAYALAFVITVVFGIWVYLKSSRKTAHVMFLLLCLSIGIYQIGHVLGITVLDMFASRAIFTMTLSLIFVVCFTVHWIASALDREKDHLFLISSTYTAGMILGMIYLIYPSSYLLDSTPKLYFPNYYEAGSFYWLLILFYAYGFGAVMRLLVRGYRRGDAAQKNRISYYIVSILVCYPLGAIGFFLAYDIGVDPIFSIPFNFFIVPLAYGVLRYDIMDVKQAARRAFGYTLFVLGTALFILGANVGNNFLHLFYPEMPGWILPLASSLIVVLFAGYIWERMKDIEALKYEFITVVTHKFRTPLTRIKWASEIIKRQNHVQEDEKIALSEIESANESLVELTDILVNLRHENEAGYLYDYTVSDLCEAVDKSVRNMKARIGAKAIQFSMDCPSERVYSSIDQRRMAFALQIILENSITYTPTAGKVKAKVMANGNSAFIKITDSGIGIAKEDLPRMFSKFWRSKDARTTDTEGMGIGLFMAREIIERHEGEVYAESPGRGKGSTFIIKLPLSKEQ
jgi:signal transduction histidine kinase